MTLDEALDASWVSPAGWQGAWLGDLEGLRKLSGEIILIRTHVDESGWIRWLEVPPLATVRGRHGWQPWGDQGRRTERKNQE